MPSPTTLFVALDPDPATSRYVYEQKARMQRLVGDQLYLDHPPHMTLYLASFDDPQQLVSALRELAQNSAAPQLAINGWHTFHNDPLTGNHTLVLDFMAEDQARLQTFQSELINHIAPLRNAHSTSERWQNRLAVLSPTEQQAALKQGFPYVGDGWHPHLTLASVKPADWPAVESEFLSTAPQLETSCPQLQVFELVNDHPHLLASIPFGVQMPKLRDKIISALWTVADQYDWVVSATLTGSFLTDDSLAAISDIDLVVIVDHLNGPRFDLLQSEFDRALRRILVQEELGLKINATLGPRKLNDDRTAVLHLMLYTQRAHHEHVIKSPFTCLDWQRSTTYRRQSMAEVYPVFGLQPHHFMHARRGLNDYLRDFDHNVVSYREIECSDELCREVSCAEPMTVRGRYEYAYHVMRFLMQNLLKLVRRRNEAPDGEALVDEFSQVFPTRAAEHRALYLQLRHLKKNRDFRQEIEHLDQRVRAFVADFELQFRATFIDTATKHLFFRHAATRLNGGHGDSRCFLGRLDPDIEIVERDQLDRLMAAIEDVPLSAVYASPLKRCRQSLRQLARYADIPETIINPGLIEIDYGGCEGLSVSAARLKYPHLFAAFEQGQDPRFPGGENSADVLGRLHMFIAQILKPAEGNTLVATHNVLLRALVGQGLAVPMREWHRIQVPHLAPISIIQTKQLGWFIDLEESVERDLFARFLSPIPEPALIREAA